MTKITPARVALYQRLKEDIDEAVSNMFGDYCAAMDLHVAYGVESFDFWGDQVRIVQDTSCRGCYNSEVHELPASALYMSSEDRTAMWKREREGEKKAEKVKAERDAADKIAYYEKKLRELKGD